MESKLVYAEVPEFGTCGRVVDRFFGVFIPAVIAKLRNAPPSDTILENEREKIVIEAYPNIKPLLSKDKRQTPLLLQQTYPHLTIH